MISRFNMMDATRFYFYPLLYVCFVFLTFHVSETFAVLNMHVGNASIKCRENERQTLLSLKQGFIDYYGNLSSWGNAENQTDCCKWVGVSCSNRTTHVVKLDLKRYELGGTINPSLSELHHLNYLDLSFNFFDNLTNFPNSIASLTHLKFLDLSRTNLKGIIPYQLGGLSRLVHLNLAKNGLFGRIPPQLANLSSLQFLDLSENSFIGTVPPTLQNLSKLKFIGLGNSYSYEIAHEPNLSLDLEWMSRLASLNTLYLQNLNLSDAKNWIKQVSNLTRLQELYLYSCGLTDSESELTWPSLSNNINSSSLTTIRLPFNKLTSFGKLLPWLLSFKDSVVTLDLDDNNLKGPIPKDFGNFSSLEALTLRFNQLEGEIPHSLFHRCTLRFLYLDNNKYLSGQFEDFIQASSGCANKSLEELCLSNNQIVGSVPDLSQFSFLKWLFIDQNKLNGTISKGIGQLSNLEVLDVAYNSLQGVITEAHFLRLSKLKELGLSYNALVFNVSSNWVPPFQLDEIILPSCNLGPTFPKWIQTQNRYSKLDLSHNQISGILPEFHLQLFDKYLGIDLSSNLLEGEAPSYLAMKASLLDLSNNRFTDANFLLCPNMTTKLVHLDISNNQFSGVLPDCWSNFESLLFLNVSYNSFSGKIPTSLGFLRQINALHLGNNRFMGELPLSLSNCKELRIFDVAQNNLAGLIPNWMGDELNKLLVLSLRSNQFSGILPYTICHLSQVQILDLSLNKISGRMPKCLNNFTALAAQTSSNALISYLLHIPGYFYIVDSVSIIWKGKESKYRSILGLVRSIDLSSNMLMGEIPSELMDLIGLVSLNISRNMISGEIPAAIGRLNSLDVLDLSRNHLFGKIPSELSQLDRLSVMDLSYNNLSGEIPHGTQLQSFDASAYLGNEELCGAPLQKCPTEHRDDGINSEDDEHFFDRGFFISMSVGFSVGFWGVCSLIFLKQSWRYAYFKLLNDAYDKLYVMVAINMAKLRRWKRGST